MPITMKKLQANIESFANTISCQQLGLAKHLPQPNAEHTNCLSNVEKYQKINGGKACYGWYFLYRSSANYGDYLIATYHAVWHNPKDLSLIDVTPYHLEEKHRPISPDGDLLFLVDNESPPLQVEYLVIPHPSRFYPTSNNSELIKYVQNMQDKEYRYYKEQYGLNIHQ